MDIRYNNIGTDFEKFDLYLNIEDYVRLFNEEPAFGKLLCIYAELAKIISANPDKLRSWVLNGTTYTEVLDITKNIYEELNKDTKSDVVIEGNSIRGRELIGVGL